MPTKAKHLITVCTILLYHIASPSPTYYNTTCLILILLFGIPHGAADHRIYAVIHKNYSFPRFILKYLLIGAGYIFWWVLMPEKALIIFLILSTYHFGQEFLEDTKMASIQMWEIMIWGCVILIAPILFSYQEIKPFIVHISKSNFLDIPKPISLALTGLITATSVCHLIIARRSNRINVFQMRKQIEMLAFLVLSFSLLPYLIAFTLYFILYHSINAFEHQFALLQNKIIGYTLKTFMLDLMLFSFISILGLVFIIYLIDPENLAELIGYFFMLISIITLPHAITFNQLYRSATK